jgi:D-arabinose 1-dehydrogenase-like Zn-dependent alcohol dehydrogenase
MSTMKAVQVSKAGGNFELVEKNIPEPGRSEVRIKVEACGICHSDAFLKEGHWPGIKYPGFPDTKSRAVSTLLELT